MTKTQIKKMHGIWTVVRFGDDLLRISGWETWEEAMTHACISIGVTPSPYAAG